MHVIATYEHEVRKDEGTFSKVDKCEISTALFGARHKNPKPRRLEIRSADLR